MKDLNIELLVIISDLGGFVYYVFFVCLLIRNFFFIVNFLFFLVFIFIWNYNLVIFLSCLYMILLIW